MKKKVILTLFLIGILMLSSCALFFNGLEGFYESEATSDGQIIQISIAPYDKTFVEYISNREVDKGNYEELGNNKYKLVSDLQTIEITLSSKNSFNITIKKLNDGKIITMKNKSKTPSYFTKEFDDVDQYKQMIKE